MAQGALKGIFSILLVAALAVVPIGMGKAFAEDSGGYGSDSGDHADFERAVYQVAVADN